MSEQFAAIFIRERAADRGSLTDAGRRIGDPVAGWIGTVAVGVRKSDTELLGKINASLAKLKANGALDKILDKWGLKAKAA